MVKVRLADPLSPAPGSDAASVASRSQVTPLRSPDPLSCSVNRKSSPGTLVGLNESRCRPEMSRLPAAVASVKDPDQGGGSGMAVAGEGSGVGPGVVEGSGVGVPDSLGLGSVLGSLSGG